MCGGGVNHVSVEVSRRIQVGHEERESLGLAEELPTHVGGAELVTSRYHVAHRQCVGNL